MNVDMSRTMLSNARHLVVIVEAFAQIASLADVNGYKRLSLGLFRKHVIPWAFVHGETDRMYPIFVLFTGFPWSMNCLYLCCGHYYPLHPKSKSYVTLNITNPAHTGRQQPCVINSPLCYNLDC